MAETSIPGAKELGRARFVIASTIAGTRSRVSARCAWASLWPIRIRRSAADVVAASRVYAKRTAPRRSGAGGGGPRAPRARPPRSEERRVGKEGESEGLPHAHKETVLR